MKIVVDTNVVISGVFFGGAPGEILKAIVSSDVAACASADCTFAQKNNKIVLKQKW